jgi:dihydroorotate dehydrogenase
MYKLIRSIFFLFDAENVHYKAMSLFGITLKIPLASYLFKKSFVIENPKLEKELFGLTFKNPVGLAAGFDKNATFFNNLFYCGFGFIEVGTLTPVGQPGNDKPRLFRLKKDNAIINRMGFNNDGVEIAVAQLKKRKHKGLIIGGNIGKNKLTPNESAVEDYLKAFNSLFDYVDYFVVNVSSPNTPNLRDLQEKEPLTNLLLKLQERNNSLPKRKPILLKIAPDLSDSQLDDIIDIVAITKIDGVIATNTTIDRSNLITPTEELEQVGAGGLSGIPLKNRSTEVIRYLSVKSNKAFPIIGVGGIHSEADALEKLEAGADLLQLYTGFIYEGPGLVKRINKAVLSKL